MLSRCLTICAAAALLTMTLQRLAAADRPADAFSAGALSQAPRDGWRTNGGSFFNQRYSPLAAIDRSNVAQLKGVWRTQLNGSGIGPQYSGAAQPIVHDGRIFIVTGANGVFALDAVTGAIVWQHTTQLDPAITAVCC